MIGSVLPGICAGKTEALVGASLRLARRGHGRGRPRRVIPTGDGSQSRSSTAFRFSLDFREGAP